MDVVLDLCGASNHATSSGDGIRDECAGRYLIAELEQSIRVRDTNLSGPHSLDRSKPYGHVLVVAEGVGNRKTGARASQLVIEGILRHFGRSFGLTQPDQAASPSHFDHHLSAALQEGHRMIVREARVKRSHRGMSTAATLAWICWPRFHLAHVGHGRCYLYRQGWLERMTTDHTLSAAAMQTERRGETGAEAADRVLYNSLDGDRDDYEPELSQFSLQPNDALVLCTEGLSRNVSTADIADVLQAEASAHGSATRLLQLARAPRNRRQDNATVVVAKFQSLDPASDTKVIDPS